MANTNPGGCIVTVEAYVTIHDQDLLLECEASGQFDAISHTYGFVGPRPVDRIPADVKLVVARDYTPNHEDKPSFYDFTGWHVLAAHDLIDADRIVCLQYDMRISDNEIGARCSSLLDAAPGPIAFTAGHRLADNWMLLLDGFHRTFDVGMARLGVDQTSWPFFNEWPSTQGMAWRTDEFQAFMMWIEPLFEIWADSVWAGHLMERTVKAWCVTQGVDEQYLGGVMVHENRDCHGTCALMGGRIETYLERTATFGR